MDTAVLLSCHGTVERADDIAAFIANIRRGHAPPAEVVAEVRRRFEHIGGSPLMRLTHAQAAALEQRLGLPVRACGRLWHPYANEVLAELAAAGAVRIVSIPMAPQSVHVYHAAVERAAAPLGLALVRAPSWGCEPRLLAAFVEAIDEQLASFSTREAAAIVLTAHSLPSRVIAAGDPYERDFRAMAEAVRARLPHPERVRIAFQSQGMGGGPSAKPSESTEWLGPDLHTTFTDLRASGVRELLVAPIGFLADHVETLYDLDVDARALAASLGFERFARMPAMNTRPSFLDALEALARTLIDARLEGLP